MMETWLAENNPAIDLISEAVRKPVFHIPQARTSEDDLLLEVLLPDIQNVRSFARAFLPGIWFFGIPGLRVSISGGPASERERRRRGHANLFRRSDRRSLRHPVYQCGFDPVFWYHLGHNRADRIESS